jgi:hypothetical protein
MKKRQGFKNMFLVALITTSSSTIAADTVLDINVTGTIAAQPVWQDGSSANITAITLDFSGLVAGPAAQDVDSAPSTAKLVNAIAYPASVALVRPANCTIGADAVNNADVHFLNNSTPVTTDSSFDIGANTDQSYALRFAAAGNYGDKSGAVSCDPGSLTYTY